MESTLFIFLTSNLGGLLYNCSSHYHILAYVMSCVFTWCCSFCLKVLFTPISVFFDTQQNVFILPHHFSILICDTFFKYFLQNVQPTSTSNLSTLMLNREMFSYFLNDCIFCCPLSCVIRLFTIASKYIYLYVIYYAYSHIFSLFLQCNSIFLPLTQMLSAW